MPFEKPPTRSPVAPGEADQLEDAVHLAPAPGRGQAGEARVEVEDLAGR